MLFVATSLAYLISAIRISFCMLIISATFFTALFPFGISPLQIINNYNDFIFGILFFAAFIPFSYGILDVIYGLTVRSLSKGIVSFDVNKSPVMLWVGVITWKVADVMGAEVGLYIEKSDIPRIYSMGSIKKHRIYISTALIAYLDSKAHNRSERDHIIGSLIAAEIANLQNYSFLPMMVLKGSDRIAKILCMLATIPFRILCIPMFLIPIIRSLMVYVMEFFTFILNILDKALYKVLYLIYGFFRYNIFDKTAENISDYQATQLASREVFIMALAMLKDKKYNDDFFIHSPAILRIKRIERIKHARDFENINPVLRSVLFCCTAFTISSIFAINAEIWLLPIFIMENLIIVHRGLVIFFNLAVHAKDLIGDAYHLFNM